MLFAEQEILEKRKKNIKKAKERKEIYEDG